MRKASPGLVRSGGEEPELLRQVELLPRHLGHLLLALAEAKDHLEAVAADVADVADGLVEALDLLLAQATYALARERRVDVQRGGDADLATVLRVVQDRLQVDQPHAASGRCAITHRLAEGLDVLHHHPVEPEVTEVADDVALDDPGLCLVERLAGIDATLEVGGGVVGHDQIGARLFLGRLATFLEDRVDALPTLERHLGGQAAGLLERDLPADAQHLAADRPLAGHAILVDEADLVVLAAICAEAGDLGVPQPLLRCGRGGALQLLQVLTVDAALHR